MQVAWGGGKWIFLDIGFSSTKRTCGFAFGNEAPSRLSFGEGRRKVLERIRTCQGTVSLVIEAPLSVCFNTIGNPKGRRIERQDGQHRYWHSPVGCMVMAAALYLIRGMYDANLNSELRVFEGFVSFKKGTGASDHEKDVRQLREIVRNSQDYQDCIYTSDDLIIDTGDTLQNAFRVSGMDFGIPAVIMAKQKA